MKAISPKTIKRSFAVQEKTLSRKDKLGKQLQKDLGVIVDSAAKQLLPGVMVTVLEVEGNTRFRFGESVFKFLKLKRQREGLSYSARQ